MPLLSRCGFVLAALLALHAGGDAVQAGMTLPQAEAPPPAPARPAAIPYGRIPPATLLSGANLDPWIIAWWRWALATPAAVNPLLDPRSTNCGAGRQPPNVRFLGGNFSGGAKDPPVIRRCVVPRGTALFFPILNAVWASTPAPNPKRACAAIEPDPWYGSRPGDPKYRLFLRRIYAPAGKDPRNPPGSLTLSIDGKPVANLERRYARSSIFFNAVLPDDNICDASLGADCFNRILVTPNVGFGYHVLVPPLPPGKHTLHWTADATLPILGALHQNVTYHLTVKR